MFKNFVITALIFALVGCGNRPYHGSDVVGVHDFVVDSYKISNGKFSILEMEGDPIEPFNDKLLEEYPDRIVDGDQLKIVVYDSARKNISEGVGVIGGNIGYQVSEGKIVLPDLPAVKVAGLTLREAKEKIEDLYENHLMSVEVFLAYEKRESQFVQLAGKVSTPGVPVNGSKRLFQVLAEARVPTEANLFKSYVIRDEKPLPVDLYRLVHKGDMSQNIVMHGGDKVFIADNSASNLIVLGEVRNEGVIPLPSGSMPLRDALGYAGGILFTGNKAYIQVIRGNLLRPKVYTISWKHIVRLPTNSMLLMPGDIVYVGATPITQWNRLVTQILPSLSIYEIFAKGIDGVIVGGVSP